MKITIPCGCKTTYEFEIEPVEGRMPSPVHCPKCGADGTKYANGFIQAQTILQGGTRILPALKDVEPALSVEELAADSTPDYMKVKASSSAKVYPPPTTPEAKMDLPVDDGQESEVYKRLWRRVQFGMLAAFLLLGVYIWYDGWGSKPAMVYSMKLSDNEGGVARCKFVGPGQLLLLQNGSVGLWDIKHGKEVWNKNLKESSPGALGRIFPMGDEIWIVFPNQAVCYERKSGEEKKKIPLQGPILSVAINEKSLLALASPTWGKQVLTRVDLASGQAQSEEKQLAELGELPTTGNTTRSSSPDDAELDASLSHQELMNEGTRPFHSGRKAGEVDKNFLLAGVNGVEMDTQLIEEKITEKAPKTAADTHKFEGKEIGIADQAAFAKDLIGDIAHSQGGGMGALEDESRYEVTLRRLLAGDCPEWKGETEGGIPSFFPLKTVDLLVGGKKLYVLDKNNRLLWESQLVFKIAGEGSGSDGGETTAPALETNDSLFFFDQGVLMAFDLKTGNVRWRLSSVGISQLQQDGKGALYVTTTSASPETLLHSDPVSVGGDVKAVVMKVDPVTGKVIWQIGRAGDECFITGKYLYIRQAQISPIDMVGAINNGGIFSHGADAPQVPVHFRIYRHDPKTGKRLWEYYRKGAPLAQDFQDNWFVFVFPKEIQVLRFYSF